MVYLASAGETAPTHPPPASGARRQRPAAKKSRASFTKAKGHRSQAYGSVNSPQKPAVYKAQVRALVPF
jgi:hypothetical protein